MIFSKHVVTEILTDVNIYYKSNIRLRKRKLVMLIMGARRGGGNLGQLPSPLEFVNEDVICSFRANYPKIFPRAIGARIKYP